MLIADRYDPTGVAAWGGMSEVHQCNDTHLARLVMLKRIKSDRNLSRLIDEQKALLKLRSKHVVELLDIISFDYNGVQELGLILEFIDGSTLREGQFSFGIDYLKVIWQIASGLADIHGAGVIHRDIKPDNIRIDSAGVVKILDFGLAREKDIDNKTRSIIGTPGYMAPELRGTKTIHFSSAIDMYSFGVTALSLLTPFKTMIGTGILSSVDNLLPSSEQSLRDLIKACLSDDPRARPTADFARDVVAGRLVFDRHRARLIDGATVVLIDKAARGRTIKTTVGQLDIWYDGEKFLCLNVQGQVNINNQIISSGSVILNSCVIIFGGYQSPQRAFVPVDLSRPEVML